MAQAKPAQVKRPLSPHLDVYRWRPHMLVSILHRMTGVALAVGAVLLTWWLTAMATGHDSFNMVQSLFGTWFGRVVLFGITFSLMQHMASGVRHLITDAGNMYDLKTNRLSAQLTLVFSCLTTVGVWVAAYMVMGEI